MSLSLAGSVGWEGAVGFFRADLGQFTDEPHLEDCILKKAIYDKNGGMTHDTVVFALALKIYEKSEAVPDRNRVRIIMVRCG